MPTTHYISREWLGDFPSSKGLLPDLGTILRRHADAVAIAKANGIPAPRLLSPDRSVTIKLPQTTGYSTNSTRRVGLTCQRHSHDSKTHNKGVKKVRRTVDHLVGATVYITQGEFMGRSGTLEERGDRGWCQISGIPKRIKINSFSVVNDGKINIEAARGMTLFMPPVMTLAQVAKASANMELDSEEESEEDKDDDDEEEEDNDDDEEEEEEEVRGDEDQDITFSSTGPSGLWEIRFEELRRHFEKYGNCDFAHVNKHNKTLGTWINNQRRSRRMKICTLTDTRISLLDSIGFDWKASVDIPSPPSVQRRHPPPFVTPGKFQFNEKEFLDQHNDLCEVCGEDGELLCCATCSLVFHLQCIRPKRLKDPSDDWSCAYCISDGVRGGKRSGTTRTKAALACREMDRMRRDMMDEGSSTDESEDDGDEKEDEAKITKRKRPWAEPTSARTVAPRISPTNVIDILDGSCRKRGITNNGRFDESQWEKRFEELKHAMTSGNDVPHGSALETWIKNQRNTLKRKILAKQVNDVFAQRIKLLNSIGFDWKFDVEQEATDQDDKTIIPITPRFDESQWEKRFEELKHAVTSGNDVPHGSALETWIKNQRYGLKRKILAKQVNDVFAQRIKLLNSIGFDWKFDVEKEATDQEEEEEDQEVFTNPGHQVESNNEIDKTQILLDKLMHRRNLLAWVQQSRVAVEKCIREESTLALRRDQELDAAYTTLPDEDDASSQDLDDINIDVQKEVRVMSRGTSSQGFNDVDIDVGKGKEVRVEYKNAHYPATIKKCQAKAGRPGYLVHLHCMKAKSVRWIPLEDIIFSTDDIEESDNDGRSTESTNFCHQRGRNKREKYCEGGFTAGLQSRIGEKYQVSSCHIPPSSSWVRGDGDGDFVPATVENLLSATMEGEPLSMIEQAAFCDAIRKYGKHFTDIARAVGTSVNRCLVHYYSTFKTGENRNVYLQEKKCWRSRALVNYKGASVLATVLKRREFAGKPGLFVHFDGSDRKDLRWIPQHDIITSIDGDVESEDEVDSSSIFDDNNTPHISVSFKGEQFSINVESTSKTLLDLREVISEEKNLELLPKDEYYFYLLDGIISKKQEKRHLIEDIVKHNIPVALIFKSDLEEKSDNEFKTSTVRADHQKLTHASQLDRKWDEDLEQLKTFKEEYGHIDVAKVFKDVKHPLRKFINTIRKSHNLLQTGRNKSSKVLTDQRLLELERIGFIFQTYLSWEYRFQELRKHFEEHGNFEVPSEDHAASLWAKKQRYYYRQTIKYGEKNCLSKSRIELLDSIGFDWRFDTQDRNDVEMINQDDNTVSGQAAAYPEEWIKCFDPTTNKVYYFNSITGVSRWERPTTLHKNVIDNHHLLDNAPVTAGVMNGLAADRSTDETIEESAPAANIFEVPDQPATNNSMNEEILDKEYLLPEGWIEFVDPATKNMYYYDPITRTSTWDRPNTRPDGENEDVEPIPSKLVSEDVDEVSVIDGVAEAIQKGSVATDDGTNDDVLVENGLDFCNPSDSAMTEPERFIDLSDNYLGERSANVSSTTIDPLPIIEQDMKNCQASDLHRHSAARDTTPEENVTSNVRSIKGVIPSIKYVWAQQSTSSSAVKHQAQLLERPSDEDGCVWIKWTSTGEEQCIPETNLMDIPSIRKRTMKMHNAKDHGEKKIDLIHDTVVGGHVYESADKKVVNMETVDATICLEAPNSKVNGTSLGQLSGSADADGGQLTITANEVSIQQPTFVTVIVTKPCKTFQMGVTLQQAGTTGDILIRSIDPGSLFVGTDLRVGMELVSIDGEKCVTIEQTGALLKTKEGQLTIVANSTSSQVVAWRCDFCGVEFDNYDATAAHELVCTNNSARVGTGVGHPSSSPAAVTMPAWECDVCGLKFDNYDVAVTHELGCSKNSTPLNPAMATSHHQ